MRVTTAVALVFVLMLAAGATSPASARPNISVSVSFFYDSLAPHGHWYDSPRYGYVWHPRNVYAGWRPYYDGHWVYTDYGWTFVSDDPWGWATYHYGRWYLDPVLGWIWVPGTEWAPSWVSFYETDDWIGWAPLPPSVGFSLAFSRRPVIDSAGYCFVEKRHFLDRDVHRRVAPLSHNAVLARRAEHIGRFSRADGFVVNHGPPVERIARATRRQVPRARVVETADFRGAERVRLQGRQVAMFRPQVSAKPTHPPRAARAVSDRQSRRPEVVQRQRPPERRALSAQQRAQRSPQLSRAPQRGRPAPQVTQPSRRGPQARVERSGPRPPRRDIRQQQQRPPERRALAQQQRPQPQRRAVSPQQRAQRSPQVARGPQRGRPAPQVTQPPRRGPQARVERSGPRQPRREIRAPARSGQQSRAIRPDRRPPRQPEVRAGGKQRPPEQQQPRRQRRPRQGPRPPGS